MENANVYLEELKKFIGEECEVTDASGNKYKGICKGLNFNYLNIILMTDKEKIIVRNIANVRRLRSVQSEPAKPASEKSVKSNK
jgi:hypothetical protein